MIRESFKVIVGKKNFFHLLYLYKCNSSMFYRNQTPKQVNHFIYIYIIYSNFSLTDSLRTRLLRNKPSYLTIYKQSNISKAKVYSSLYLWLNNNCTWQNENWSFLDLPPTVYKQGWIKIVILSGFELKKIHKLSWLFAILMTCQIEFY